MGSGQGQPAGGQPLQPWSSGLGPWASQLLQQDDLVTPPSNVEAPLLPGGAGGGGRAAPQCLLCGGLGTSAVCGTLRPATYEGQPAAVHHLCAVWSPGCFQREVGAGAAARPAAVACRRACLNAFRLPDLLLAHPHLPQGSSVYINLEEEARRSRSRTCSVCGLAGASLLCAHPG